jgi:hypothetical protein
VIEFFLPLTIIQVNSCCRLQVSFSRIFVSFFVCFSHYRRRKRKRIRKCQISMQNKLKPDFATTRENARIPDRFFSPTKMLQENLNFHHSRCAKTSQNSNRDLFRNDPKTMEKTRFWISLENVTIVSVAKAATMTKPGTFRFRGDKEPILVVNKAVFPLLNQYFILAPSVLKMTEPNFEENSQKQ